MKCLAVVLVVVAAVQIATFAWAIEGAIFVQNSGGYSTNVFCTPEGNGETMNYPIGVQLFDDGSYLSGISAENIRLFIGTHGFGMPHDSWLCDQTYIEASSNSNALGIAYFPTGPYYLFNNSYGNPYRFHVEVLYDSQWNRIFPEAPPIGFPNCLIYWKTPDLNGDQIVSLTDLGLFSSMYYNQEYDRAIDYNSDSQETLTDVGLFTSAMEEECQ